MKIQHQGRLLIASFEEPQAALSWAIEGGGRKQTQSVVWCQVQAKEIEPPVDAREFLRNQLLQNHLCEAVGMLTSADLETYEDVTKEYGTLFARSIVTVGMGNALRVGDPPRGAARSPERFESKDEAVCVGTINLLCAVSVPISEEVHLEALSIAVEARTAAVLEARIPSSETGFSSTGTGTDCVVVTAPWTEKEQVKADCAGKHTPLGYLIGSSVYEAVRRGLDQWKKGNSKQ